MHTILDTPRIVDVNAATLELDIIADPSITAATLTAPHGTTATERDGHWTVTVPTPHTMSAPLQAGTLRNVVINVTTSTTTTPRAVLRIPARTVVRARITTGTLTTTGPIRELAITGDALAVEVEQVYRVAANITSGRITVGRVTGSSNLLTVTAPITVRQGGTADNLISTSGHLAYNPGPDTTRVSARTITGHITAPLMPGVDARLTTTSGHIHR